LDRRGDLAVHPYALAALQRPAPARVPEHRLRSVHASHPSRRRPSRRPLVVGAAGVSGMRPAAAQPRLFDTHGRRLAGKRVPLSRVFEGEGLGEGRRGCEPMPSLDCNGTQIYWKPSSEAFLFAFHGDRFPGIVRAGWMHIRIRGTTHVDLNEGAERISDGR
jgi:hypothetical protein